MGATIAPAVRSTTLLLSDLGPRKRDSALQLLVSRATAAGIVREPDAVREALALRERLGITTRAKGVAIAEVRSLGVTEPAVLIGRSARGIDWDAADEQPVHLLLLALSPADLPIEAHLESLSRLAAATRLARQRTRLLEAADAESAGALIRAGTP